MSEKPVKVAPSRAGFVIYGRQEDKGRGREPAVIVSFMEGKVGKDAKMHTMPAGGIKKNVPPIRAAAEECFEEVGIDPIRLLGADRFAELERAAEREEDKVIGGFASPGYPGVYVKRVNATPVLDEEVTSLDGCTKRTLVWGIEVDHIEKLDPHLKGAIREGKPNANPDFVLCSTRERMNLQHYPLFRTLIEGMRIGKLPHHELVKTPSEQVKMPGVDDYRVRQIPQKYHDLFGDTKPVLPLLERKYDMMVRTQEDMNSLYYRLEASDKDLLQPQLCAVKYALEKDGLVGDKGEGLKCCTDYRPLNLYQEGGARVPIAKLLQYSLQFLRRYPLESETSWRRATPDKPIRTEGVATGATTLRSLCELANRLNDLLLPEPPRGQQAKPTKFSDRESPPVQAAPRAKLMQSVLLKREAAEKTPSEGFSR
jgi:8-oxo-dGTP pyrophosphatase MutT (NUDIX family)